MSPRRVLVLSVVLVILCGVHNSNQCAKKDHGDADHQHNEQIIRSEIPEERSVGEPSVHHEDKDDILDAESNNLEQTKRLGPEPEEEEEEEEEDLDVEELAEGEMEDAEKTAPARYDGAQLWRIHTSNVSNQDVIKLFESQYGKEKQNLIIFSTVLIISSSANQY